jgi:hypothetical protein
VPRLLPEATPLSTRALTFVAAAAAGAAFAGFGGLMSRWCASAGLGWAIALAAAAVGAFAGSRGAEPDDEAARSWLVGGSLAALALPALLRVLGLSLAEPALLQEPLGGLRSAAFVLGQAALLAALSAGAWTRAARRGGRPAARAAALGAAAGACVFRWIDPAALVSAAGLSALAAAEWAERPWARRESAPLRSRVFAAAAVVGLLLAPLAPGLLRDVWMARLHSAYPGGRYLSYADDGRRTWAAYVFSTGNAVVLRDGLIQSQDLKSSRLALCALLSQFEGSRTMLILDPTTPQLPMMAAFGGAAVRVERVSPALEAAFDALTGGAWRAGLSTAAAAAFKPDSALLLLPADARAPGVSALRTLRGRMGANAALSVLIASDAPAGTADALVANAATAFGRARAADLPRGTLVVASSDEVVSDPQVLFGRLTAAVRASYPDGDHELTADVRWRPSPPAK